METHPMKTHEEIQEEVRLRLIQLAKREAALLCTPEAMNQVDSTWFGKLAACSFVSPNEVMQKLPWRYFGCNCVASMDDTASRGESRLAFHPCVIQFIERWKGIGLDVTTLQLTQEHHDKTNTTTEKANEAAPY